MKYLEVDVWPRFREKTLFFTADDPDFGGQKAAECRGLCGGRAALVLREARVGRLGRGR